MFKEVKYEIYDWNIHLKIFSKNVLRKVVQVFYDEEYIEFFMYANLILGRSFLSQNLFYCIFSSNLYFLRI